MNLHVDQFFWLNEINQNVTVWRSVTNFIGYLVAMTLTINFQYI